MVWESRLVDLFLSSRKLLWLEKDPRLGPSSRSFALEPEPIRPSMTLQTLHQTMQSLSGIHIK